MATVAERLSDRPSQEDRFFSIGVLVSGVEPVAGDANDSSLRVEGHVSRNGHGRRYIHRVGKTVAPPVIIPVASDAYWSDLFPERGLVVVQGEPGVAFKASHLSGQLVDGRRIRKRDCESDRCKREKQCGRSSRSLHLLNSLNRCSTAAICGRIFSLRIFSSPSGLPLSSLIASSIRSNCSFMSENLR